MQQADLFFEHSSRSDARIDRLFVPLATDPHTWFRSGKKTWELRKLGRQYTEKHVRPGRMVELRKGYTDKSTSIWGWIENIVVAESLADFFEEVPWKSVLPKSTNLHNAIKDAEEILGVDSGSAGPFIGFKVDVETSRCSSP